MNALALIAQTMTSREITELVQSRHDKVKQSIERLAASGVIQLPPLREVKNHLGQMVGEYHMGKRDCLVIVAQLSPIFLAVVVDRWQELEDKAASTLPALPTTFAAALRQLADQTEQSALQAAELALAAPKVAFVDDYVTAEGNKPFRQVCKLLAANERHFGKWLDEAGITYRLAGERTARAQHIAAGRFVAKTGNGKNGTDEKPGHAYVQILFTPKGVTWVAGEWAKHQLASGAN